MKLLSLLTEELGTNPADVLSQLNNIPNLQNKRDLAQKSLPYINKGETRIVYEFGEGKVLKLALFPAGIEDNTNEVELFQCSGPKFLAEIFAHAPDFSWIVMEKVMVVPEDRLIRKLKQLTGHQFRKAYEFGYVIHYGRDGWGEYAPLYKQLTETSEWFREFDNTVAHCKIGMNDLHENNLGIRYDAGDLVVLDYGFKS